MRACKPLPYGQLTTALVPTVPSPCFLRQSSTFAKVRETFCVSFVLIRFVVGKLLSEVGGRVGHDRTENHARSAIISTTMSLQTTVSQEL